MTGTNWNIESHHTGSDFLSTQYCPLSSYYQILYSSLSHTIGHNESKGGQEGLENPNKKKKKAGEFLNNYKTEVWKEKDKT